MKTEYQIIWLLFIHWIADFLLQTGKMALNKSKSNKWLFIHVLTYSLTWGVILLVSQFIQFIDTSLFNILLFTFFTGAIHFITDFYTSRWTSYLYAKQQYYGFPGFFHVIGFDQWLHYIQIITMYSTLIGF